MKKFLTVTGVILLFIGVALDIVGFTVYGSFPLWFETGLTMVTGGQCLVLFSVFIFMLGRFWKEL